MLALNTPVSITTQPTNQTAAAGGVASFTAAASGSPTPSVQWQVSTDGGINFSNLPGATNATLILTNISAVLNGNRYRAAYTNSCNTVTTNAAMLIVTCTTITLNPATLQNGQLNQPYGQTLTASGGTAPYTFTVSAGALPSNVTLSSSGLLAGTPTGSGIFNFTVKATDTNGCMGTQSHTLSIATSGCQTITVNPTSLPASTTFTFYSQTISASGGTAPYTFTISAGALPAGMTLASNGS
jgi:large repetitive protein